MELQEFIKNTLVQITNGVKEAQEELKDSGCLINPEGFNMNGGQIKSGYENKYRSVQKIKMNVVLNVEETQGSTSKIGVAKLLHAGIGSEENSSTNQMTSIEFEIPVAFPIMD